jgi:hypothetical protein
VRRTSRFNPNPENGSDGPVHYLDFKNSKVSPIEDHAKATSQGAAPAQQLLDQNQGLAAGSQGRVMGLPIGSVPMTPTWHGRGSRAMPSGVRVPPLGASPRSRGGTRRAVAVRPGQPPNRPHTHLSSRSALSGVGERTPDNQVRTTAQGPVTPDTQLVGRPLSVSSSCQSPNPAGASGCHGQWPCGVGTMICTAGKSPLP